MINMWKKILKIDMEEARRLGDRYSPKDMDDARDEKARVNQEEIKPVILMSLRMYMREQDEEQMTRYRASMVHMLREFPNTPTLSRKTDTASKNMNEHKILTALGEKTEA